MGRPLARGLTATHLARPLHGDNTLQEHQLSRTRIVQEALIRELSIAYILEDMPHTWTPDLEQRLQWSWAPESAQHLMHALGPADRGLGATLLRQAAADPEGAELVRETIRRGRYAWLFSERRRHLLILLLTRMPEELEREGPAR